MVAVNKVSVHILMRNRDEAALLNAMAALHRAGRPFGLVTNVGPDEIPCDKLLGASPLTKIVLRIWPGGGSGMELNVRDYYNNITAGAPSRKLAHFHQVNNEMNDWSPAAIAWWKYQIILARDFHLALPTPPMGTPEVAVYQRSDVLDLMRMVRDNGHLWAVHEYERPSQGDWTLGRFVRHVYPTLPPDLRNNMPMVGFTEWGDQGGRDWPPEVFSAKIAQWRVLLDYPWIIGAAAWSYGDGGVPAYYGAEDWRPDNFANKLAILAS